MLKRSLIVLSIVSMFLVVLPIVASADTQCGDPAFNNASSTVTFIRCGNGSPENVQSPWGKNIDVPQINPGTLVLFKLGNVTIDLGCPAFFTSKCSNITVSQYWKTNWGTGLVSI